MKEATAQRPLAGRTVMVTRAREQAGEFAAALEGFGARVVFCPTIEIVAPETYAPLDEAVENLFGYDWLVFTSANAVEHFCRRLEASGMSRPEIAECFASLAADPGPLDLKPLLREAAPAEQARERSL